MSTYLVLFYDIWVFDEHSMKADTRKWYVFVPRNCSGGILLVEVACQPILGSSILVVQLRNHTIVISLLVYVWFKTQSVVLRTHHFIEVSRLKLLVHVQAGGPCCREQLHGKGAVTSPCVLLSRQEDIMNPGLAGWLHATNRLCIQLTVEANSCTYQLSGLLRRQVYMQHQSLTWDQV